jgi:hypothetical protein
VLVNHIYKPIARPKIELPSLHQSRTATSTESVPVEAARTDRGTTLLLPLEWTDVVLLPRKEIVFEQE